MYAKTWVDAETVDWRMEDKEMNQQMDRPIEKWKRGELIDFFRKYKEEIESAQTSLEKIKGVMSEHQETLETLPSKLEQAQEHSEGIEELNQKTVGIKQEIDEIKTDIEDRQKRIGDFYSNLFEGEEVEGESPYRVLSIEDQIQIFQKNSEKQFDDLKAKIEGLLPGATSAGLASSYQEAQEEKKTWPYWIGFVVSLVLLMSQYYYYFVHNAPHVDLSTVVIRVTIGFPLIWIAWFCQKSISQMTRISEEYRHKEKMMRIYDGFSKQIEQSTDAEEARTKKVDLISVIIGAIGKNPAEKSDPSGTFLDTWKSNKQRKREEED